GGRAAPRGDVGLAAREAPRSALQVFPEVPEGTPERGPPPAVQSVDDRRGRDGERAVLVRAAEPPAGPREEQTPPRLRVVVGIRGGVFRQGSVRAARRGLGQRGHETVRVPPVYPLYAKSTPPRYLRRRSPHQLSCDGERDGDALQARHR